MYIANNLDAFLVASDIDVQNAWLTNELTNTI